MSKLPFEKPWLHFDSASIGICPKYRRLKEKADNRVPFNWDEAVEVVQERFGKLMGQPAKTISIFHNTTAAVQRVLLRLSQLFGSSQPTLLLTDLEYPGIVSAVDEEWAGRVVMAKVSNLIWDHGARGITEKLKKCLLMSRPSIIYLSHIARASGYRIEENEIISFIRNHMPQTVVVLDGAQACGNIKISSELLKSIDIYVTSGHKWLCGKQTLGLVYASEEWRLKDPAQSYSMTRVPTGTGSREVISSLASSLSDFNGELRNELACSHMDNVERHNAYLAESFCKRIRRVAKHIARTDDANPSAWRWNGIATVVFNSPDLAASLKQEYPDLRFTLLGNESWRDDFGGTPPGNRYLLDPDSEHPFEDISFRHRYVPKVEGYPARFCFHYYHSLADVDRLVEYILKAEKAMNRRRSARTGRPQKK